MRKHYNNTIESGNLDTALAPDEGLSQEGFLEIALRHRWIVLLTVILFLSAGFFYLLTATPIYTSTSRLYVEQSGPKIITEYEGLMTQSKNYLYTQSELIKSTPIVADAVSRFIGTQIKRLRTFAEVDNLVTYLKKTLNVKVGKKDDIITVSFDSPYPNEAAQIVNTVVDSYIGYHSTRRRSTVYEVLKILQKEKVKRDKELSEKFERLLEFTRTNGVVSFNDNGGHIAFQRLSKLSEALTEAQLTAINAKADYEAIESMAGEPAKIKQFAAALSAAPMVSIGVRIFINDEETQLRSELKDLEVKLKNARYHCTEEHPSIRAINEKIDYIKQQIQSQAKEFAEAYIGAMRQRWMTTKQREDELLVSFSAQREEAQSLGVKAAEYSVLQSELRRTERLCDILDERIKEINVTENAGALNISILEVARAADKPSKPQKTSVMTIALALGVMLGCGFALLCNWLDCRLRSIEEVSAVLGIPVLGVVPTMSEGQTIAAHGQRVWLDFKVVIADAYRTIGVRLWRMLGGVSGGKTKTIAVKQDPRHKTQDTRPKTQDPRHKTQDTRPKTQDPRLESGVWSLDEVIAERGQEVRLKPKSVVAEAYRTIRTAVFFGVPKDEAKTIVVTSPAPGDGKTTLVSNLAIAMAQAGQKTLILDCDFRKPMQHSIFRIDNEKGLSSVFAGSITLDQAIRSIKTQDPGHKTQDPDLSGDSGFWSLESGVGLDLLPCGPEVPNPSELLNSKVFVEILEELSQRYDRVIIDSPPAIPVADSQILGAICDVTLLVLRADRSTRRLSQRAMNSLLSIGAQVLGAVVNDVSRTGDSYGYYADYRYYNYGRSEKKRKYQQTPKPVIESLAKATKKRATSKRSTAEKGASSFDAVSTVRCPP